MNKKSIFPKNLQKKPSRKVKQDIIDAVPYPTISYINIKAKEPHVIGNVTSGTINTLTDDTAEWEVNQWVDKVVKLYKVDGSDFCFGLVLSNSVDTLTFDLDLLTIPCESCGYTILDTFVLSSEDLNKIIAIGIFDYNIGIVLPKVTHEIERKYIHSYIERSNNGDHTAVMMSRSDDYQLGAKYGNLNYNGEGVTLYAHTWDNNNDTEGDDARPHWDIVNLQGIQRIASGYWDNNELITSDTPSPYGANIVFDTLRRFTDLIVNSNYYVRYTSLIQRKFFVQLVVTIFKSGGGVGEATAQLGIIRAGSTELEILTKRYVTTRFGAGEGYENLNLNVPLLLNRNDQVIAIFSRTAGTMSVMKGSTINIFEV